MVGDGWTYSGNHFQMRDTCGRANGVCELCGHKPIGEGYILDGANGAHLVVGCECVQKYPYWVTDHHTELAKLHRFARMIARQCGVEYSEAARIYAKHPHWQSTSRGVYYRRAGEYWWSYASKGGD